MYQIAKSLSVVVLVLSLSACGGGGSSERVGKFIDDDVRGLSYSCSSGVLDSQKKSGLTDSNGSFNYIVGQRCTFSVGKVTLGPEIAIPNDGIVTPQDVAGVTRSATNAPSALSIAQFLQSLNDGTSSGKIVISPSTLAAFGNVKSDAIVSNSGSISPTELQTLVETTLGKKLVSAEVAKLALDSQISAGVVKTSESLISANAPPVLNSILVSSSAQNNPAGLTAQMSAIGFYNNGTSSDISNSVIWTSSDTSKLTLNNSGLAKGLIQGNVSVTASLTPSGSPYTIKGSFLQQTAAPILASLSINNSNSLPAGLTDQLIATGTLTDESKVDLTKLVTWTSSDITKLTIDSNGLVSGVAMGTATVTARYTPLGGAAELVASFNETVLAPNPLNLVISFVQSVMTSIYNFTSVLLNSTLTYTDRSVKTVSSLINWLVNPPAGKVIAVDNNNNSATLSATQPGIISIIGSYLGLTSNTLNLTVVATPPVTKDVEVLLDVSGTSSSTITGQINSTDPQGYALTYAIQSQGETGQANINSNTGVFTYTISGHTTSFFDSFKVSVSNGVNSSVSKVSVTLNTDPLLRNQWHIQNIGYSAFASVLPKTGIDMNVAGAWAAGYTGKGVKVAVLDSGLEIAHEDLSANVESGKSYNFINKTLDPTPSDIGPDHGTMVAGIIGAAAFNGKGGRGVAYNSKLRGYNSIAAGANTSANLAYSFGGSPTNAGQPESNDLDIVNKSSSSSNMDLPLFSSTTEAYIENLKTLRNGKGAIFVQSNGNTFSTFGSASNNCTTAKTLGVSCGNPSNDQRRTSPVTINVGALNSEGIKSSYSTTGSSIWISAPGGEFGKDSNLIPNLSSNSYKPAIVTTALSGCKNADDVATKVNLLDSQGDNQFAKNCQYTALMNGTSSAAPNTAGVVALMLEANPNLSYRDVKHILATTAKKIDASNSGVTSNGVNLDLGWVTNAAGFNFSNSYGFGAIDAASAVASAKNYTSYLPSQISNSSSLGYTSPVTVTNAGRTLTFNLTTPFSKVEQVALTFNMSNATGTPAPLSCNQIELISPSGTRSILMHYGTGYYSNSTTPQTKAAVITPTTPYKNSGVRLLTNAFYGEPSTGSWALKFFNYCSSSSGVTTLSSSDYQTLTLYGH